MSDVQDDLVSFQENFAEALLSRERKIQPAVDEIKRSLQALTNRIYADIRARGGSVSLSYALIMNEEEDFNDWIRKLRGQTSESEMYAEVSIRSLRPLLRPCQRAADLCAEALRLISQLREWRMGVTGRSVLDKDQIITAADLQIYKKTYKPKRTDLDLHLSSAWYPLESLLDHHKSLEAQVPQDIMCDFREGDNVKRKAILDACWNAALEEQKADTDVSKFPAQVMVIVILLRLTENPEIELQLQNLEKVVAVLHTYMAALGDFE